MNLTLLGIISKWNRTLFVLWWLAHFIPYGVIKAHPWIAVLEYSLAFLIPVYVETVLCVCITHPWPFAPLPLRLLRTMLMGAQWYKYLFDISILLALHTKEGFLGHMVVLDLIFEELPYSFPRCYAISHSHEQYTRVQFLHIFTSICYFLPSAMTGPDLGQS